MVGLDQCGLAGTVAASISAVPEEIQGMFWANIGLVGGTAKDPRLNPLHQSVPVRMISLRRPGVQGEEK